MGRPQILLLDADASRRATLHDHLAHVEGDVVAATTWTEAVRTLRRRKLAVVHVDVRAPGVPAPAEVIERIAGPDGTTEVVIAGVAPGSDPACVGDPRAFDVTSARTPPERSAAVLEAALRHAAAVRETRSLRARLRAREGFDGLVGRTPAISVLRERIERLAAGDGPVLFVGEPGSGRTLAARTLHQRSARSDGPFVLAHLSAFPPDRLPDELFGGAGHGGRGATVTAGGGTLHLDGADRLPRDVQSRLATLRDVRVTASVRVDPARAVEDGRLDGRWLERFGDAVVRIPPLRERLDDVPVLARHFLDGIAEINGLPRIRLGADVVDVLVAHAWPGNVLELRNALERAAILAEDGRLRVDDLPERVRGTASRAQALPGPEAGATFRDAKQDVVRAFERRYLDDLMRRHGGNVTAAAQEAGMLRSALQRLLRKHRMRSAEYRSVRSRTMPTPDDAP